MIDPSYLIGRKEEAKRIVRDHLFRPYIDNSGDNSAVQQRLYERKTLMAFHHLQGTHTSDLLTAEARIRDVTVNQLATEILAKAEELNQVEIRRMEINVLIDACAKLSDIAKLFIDQRIPLPPQVLYFDAED